ncbi:protocadherin alpha-3-like isoform X3 [Perca fluviatilis]|uniref:protocadherin alpha-3-like isoform X3 n=1 Tax=Perca fluviatilis TaxID=8168 RepID=UPI001962E76F|nr:protocadherin alpha-3-like isoform X3 [Perca fluviatilis]
MLDAFGFVLLPQNMKQRGREAWRQQSNLIAVLFLLLFFRVASAQLRYSIAEELKEGSFVGNIAKDLGIDLNLMKQRGFRIMSGSTEPLFKVNENDGILYANHKIDREEVCKESSACLINLKTVLENPLEVHYVTVEITDLNDHSPTFPEKTKRLEISESALPGARYQLQNAHDPDGGTNSVQQYKISQNDHFRLEIKDRGRDGKTPILQLQRQLDREAKRSHKLVLTAIDGGNPTKTGTVEIYIDVLDVNDNMPVFTKDTYSAVLQENAPAGTTVIQVNATDLDDGPNGEVVYSFGSDVKGKIRELFDIDSVTGEIIVKGRVDFEEQDSYDIDIQASDKGSIPFRTDKSVIIKIGDTNDNPPEIEVASLSSAVSEDSRPGTTIALISITDLDSALNGKIISYVAEDSPFTLTPSIQDNMFAVVTKSQLDREQQSIYDITIIAKDAGEPALTSEKTISVFVSDINDNSPMFSVSPYSFYITENNLPGASLFSVRASDRDEGDNALISYHILRNAGYENKVTSFLNINSETGDILALKGFDFETLKTFQFQVVATDSGTPSLSSNVTVNVFILDQNDNAPVILYPVSSNGSAEGVEEIPRNVNAGHLVTKVRAYDADIGYNGWLLFSLQDVTDHSLFGLDRYTGQIRTLRSFTETDEAEHKLVILVKDNGNVSLSATATVLVKVVEPKEAFAASDVKSATKNEEENNVTFYLMITLGSVSTLFLISIIVLIAMQCSKTTDYTSKYLQETNYDGTLCHSIQYRSGDKRYMLVGPRMSIGSTIVPGSHANTLVLPDRRPASEEPKGPGADWRYSASLRAGGVMQSSVHMEESSVMQGAQGVLVQNWPTASSAADAEGGEVSPPMGAGVDSNSWHFRYGPGGPGAPPQHLKPGEVPPEAFIIPGSPAIISIRQNQGGEDDKSDFITFGKKEEAKKKKKKKKEKKDKKDKGKDDGDE